MKEKPQYDFMIGGHLLRVAGLGSDMKNVGGFQPFALEKLLDEEPLLTFITDAEISENTTDLEDLYSFDFEFDNMQSVFSRHKNGYCYRMILDDKQYAMWYENGNPTVKTNLSQGGKKPNPTMLRNMLWTTFAMIISAHDSIAIHSSTVVCNGKAIMCLGESGTGKSTHTRMWYENIEGAKLLNDDCPILRLENNEVVVYGSPWSGKTPCYRAEKFPVAAIIRIVRAPHNKMILQNTLGAFAAMQPSCPPAFAYDELLSDNMYKTLSEILKRVKVYNLQCLPNADAAKTAYKEIFENA